jgi:aldose 1-epimerase
MTGMRQSPGITWPRLLTLTVTSDMDQWVIFNERPNALCIEPQSAAPDVFNRELGDEHVLEPGEQATATARISWQR